MEPSTILAIFCGIVGLATIAVKKCKIYVHKTPEGKYNIAFGMLDKPLPINKEE